MSNAIEKLLGRVNIGEPSIAGALTVFPLFPLDRSAVRYRLLCDATADGSTQVTEVEPPELASGRSAWFNLLAVANKGPGHVLVRDSDILTGGRQDRKAGRTCLVAADSRAIIPVMCVEHGRASYTGSRTFTTSPMAAVPDLRRMSMRKERGDEQERTWARVARHRTESGLADGDGSFAEVERVKHRRVAGLAEKLPPVLNACGLVIAVMGVVQAVEIHADRTACAAAWSGLVRSIALLPRGPGRPPRISRTEVRRYFGDAARAESEELPAVGIGSQRRLAFHGGVGSVLVLDDSIAHVALLAA